MHQVALRISGAKNVLDLTMQLELAKSGDFMSLERQWLKDGASRGEVKKRLGQAMQVRLMCLLSSKDAAHCLTTNNTNK
jgi:hypothetical protein